MIGGKTLGVDIKKPKIYYRNHLHVQINSKQTKIVVTNSFKHIVRKQPQIFYRKKEMKYIDSKLFVRR